MAQLLDFFGVMASVQINSNGRSKLQFPSKQTYTDGYVRYFLSLYNLALDQVFREIHGNAQHV